MSNPYEKQREKEERRQANSKQRSNIYGSRTRSWIWSRRDSSNILSILDEEDEAAHPDGLTTVPEVTEVEDQAVGLAEVEVEQDRRTISETFGSTMLISLLTVANQIMV